MSEIRFTTEEILEIGSRKRHYWRSLDVLLKNEAIDRVKEETRYFAGVAGTNLFIDDNGEVVVEVL